MMPKRHSSSFNDGSNESLVSGDSASTPNEERKRSRQKTTAVDAATVLNAYHSPEFDAIHLPEPSLVFGDDRREPDPKTGLALHKPFDLHLSARHSTIRLGIIGTGEMIDATHRWLERCRGRVLPTTQEKIEDGQLVPKLMDPVTHTLFPGLAEVFEADFVVGDNMESILTKGEIDALLDFPYFEQRVTKLVELVVRRLSVLAEGMQTPDVVIVALPTEVRKKCTIPAHHKTRGREPYTLAHALRDLKAKDRETGQQSLFGFTPEEESQIAALDEAAREQSQELGVFHHGLKAAAMPHGIPTQLAWQTTLEGSPTVENDATRAWNFWTGVYYKAGGIPWRVAGLDRGTCYVGIAFYRDRHDGSMRTSMAQAFSDRAEGVVLRSEPFRWSPSERSRTPHLPEELAKDLMARVIDAYKDVHHQPPTRIVVHKWQRYADDERHGFVAAITDAGIHTYDLVAFGDRGIRFFRAGAEPPLRGTMVSLPGKSALLYTRGYTPYLALYSGMRVPRPIELVEHHGSSAMKRVCEEILALTKMDWNSSAFAGKEPITTAFSEDVGHILAELKDGVQPRTTYRFYM